MNQQDPATAASADRAAAEAARTTETAAEQDRASAVTGGARSAPAQQPESAAAPASPSAPAAPKPARRPITATDLALIATFAALVAVGALLPAISTGGLVPITLQTFAVMLTGAVLGARRGFLALVLYLAVGALGMPIFSMGRAGLEPFVGPSAGYLIAFPFAAMLAGFIVERLPRKRIATSIPLIFLAGFGSSLVFIHTLGPLGMSVFGDLSLGQAFAADLVFYPGDVIKNLLMAIVATAVHRAFPALLPPRRQGAVPRPRRAP